MILVDSSVWIDHFRSPVKTLQDLLTKDMVYMHDFVIGEVAMGSLKQRSKILMSMSKLQYAKLASNAEVMMFIDHLKLFGLGLGYVDAHLLLSARLSDAPLWTRDKRLSAAATQLNVAFAAER